MSRILVLLLALSFTACKSDNKIKPDLSVTTLDIPEPTTLDHYFPVTNYLLGEIANIRASFVQPLMITTEGKKKDSIWLNLDTLEIVMEPFLHPVIDTTNMRTLYRETKFEDETLETYTFSYEPYKALPDTFELFRWDVYVSTLSNRVQSVHMMKRTGKDKQRQLVWNSNKSCEITDVVMKNGEVQIEKEVLIKWKF